MQGEKQAQIAFSNIRPCSQKDLDKYNQDKHNRQTTSAFSKKCTAATRLECLEWAGSPETLTNAVSALFIGQPSTHGCPLNEIRRRMEERCIYCVAGTRGLSLWFMADITDENGTSAGMVIVTIKHNEINQLSGPQKEPPIHLYANA